MGKEEFDVIALNNSNPNDCRDLFAAHIYPNPEMAQTSPLILPG